MEFLSFSIDLISFPFDMLIWGFRKFDQIWEYLFFGFGLIIIFLIMFFAIIWIYFIPLGILWLVLCYSQRWLNYKIPFIGNWLERSLNESEERIKKEEEHTLKLDKQFISFLIHKKYSFDGEEWLKIRKLFKINIFEAFELIHSEYKSYLSEISEEDLNYYEKLLSDGSVREKLESLFYRIK